MIAKLFKELQETYNTYSPIKVHGKVIEGRIVGSKDAAFRNEGLQDPISRRHLINPLNIPESALVSDIDIVAQSTFASAWVEAFRYPESELPFPDAKGGEDFAKNKEWIYHNRCWTDKAKKDFEKLVTVIQKHLQKSGDIVPLDAIKELGDSVSAVTFGSLFCNQTTIGAVDIYFRTFTKDTKPRPKKRPLIPCFDWWTGKLKLRNDGTFMAGLWIKEDDESPTDPRIDDYTFDELKRLYKKYPIVIAHTYNSLLCEGDGETYQVSVGDPRKATKISFAHLWARATKNPWGAESRKTYAELLELIQAEMKRQDKLNADAIEEKVKKIVDDFIKKEEECKEIWGEDIVENEDKKAKMSERHLHKARKEQAEKMFDVEKLITLLSGLNIDTKTLFDEGKTKDELVKALENPTLGVQPIDGNNRQITLKFFRYSLTIREFTSIE